MRSFGTVMLITSIIYCFFAEIYTAFLIWGVSGLLLGVFAFPVMMIAMPIYSIITYGKWVMFAMTILGILGRLLMNFGTS